MVTNFGPKIRGLTDCKVSVSGWVGNLQGQRIVIAFRYPWLKCWPVRLLGNNSQVLQSRNGKVYLARKFEPKISEAKKGKNKYLILVATSFSVLVSILVNTALTNQVKPAAQQKAAEPEKLACQNQSDQDIVIEKLWNGNSVPEASIELVRQLQIGGIREDQLVFKCNSIKGTISVFSSQKDSEWKFLKIARPTKATD